MGRRDERILSCVFMAIVRYHFLNGESKLIFNYWLALIGKKYFYSSFFSLHLHTKRNKNNIERNKRLNLIQK